MAVIGAVDKECDDAGDEECAARDGFDIFGEGLNHGDENEDAGEEEHHRDHEQPRHVTLLRQWGQRGIGRFVVTRYKFTVV